MTDQFYNIQSTPSKEDVVITKPITCREKEVLIKMSLGLTVKEIASQLCVSDHTIVSHKKNLLFKCQARNSVELVVKAIRNGTILL